MGLVDIALMPARAMVATAEVVIAIRDLAAPSGPVRRAGGYGERLDALLAEDGAIEQRARLSDPEGPLARIEQLAVLTGDDRPLGRALAADGPLDRLLAEGGAIDRLVKPGGPLERLLAEEGAVERLLYEHSGIGATHALGVYMHAYLADGNLPATASSEFLNNLGITQTQYETAVTLLQTAGLIELIGGVMTAKGLGDE